MCQIASKYQILSSSVHYFTNSTYPIYILRFVPLDLFKLCDIVLSILQLSLLITWHVIHKISFRMSQVKLVYIPKTASSLNLE